MTSGRDTIWELVRQASETLPEPFSRAALITWISKRRPDVEISSIGAHIQAATANAANTVSNLADRTPLLVRVDRGLYRRYRPADPVSRSRGAALPRPQTVQSTAFATPAERIILVGCSKTKGLSAMPAGELFRGQGFQLARDYAVRSGSPWFVLSAKFGLLEPSDVVGPYDVYLGKQPAAYRSVWGEWVVGQLSLRQDLLGMTVEVHAGEAYTGPLREPLRRRGAVLTEPLEGLSRGERLAWPGYRVSTSSVHVRPAGPWIDILLDPRNALCPADFLAGGAAGRDVPGLYTWWIDADGALELSAGIGHRIPPGLLYAGKAGGHRTNAAPSTSTLWGRVGGNHLRGNVHASTFRKSLAALLARNGGAPSEEQLTTWMHNHLRVAVLPVPSGEVAAREAELVERADPPSTSREPRPMTRGRGSVACVGWYRAGRNPLWPPAPCRKEAGRHSLSRRR